ncbi:MAG: hypothetical protein OIN66_14825 [Candidatus Methanoperedens sp.]|nr:hypothetical protein [Candidatus Methanoperedens sp.]
MVETKDIFDALILERQAIKSRYPLFTNPERPIWIPSHEYTEHDADDAYRKAITILKTIKQFLKEKYNISSVDIQ